MLPITDCMQDVSGWALGGFWVVFGWFLGGYGWLLGSFWLVGGPSEVCTLRNRYVSSRREEGAELPMSLPERQTRREWPGARIPYQVAM